MTGNNEQPVIQTSLGPWHNTRECRRRPVSDTVARPRSLLNVSPDKVQFDPASRGFCPYSGREQLAPTEKRGGERSV